MVLTLHVSIPFLEKQIKTDRNRKSEISLIIIKSKDRLMKEWICVYLSKINVEEEWFLGVRNLNSVLLLCFSGGSRYCNRCHFLGFFFFLTSNSLSLYTSVSLRSNKQEKIFSRNFLGKILRGGKN